MSGQQKGEGSQGKNRQRSSKKGPDDLSRGRREGLRYGGRGKYSRRG